MARVHFIGICGTAMATLAAMLKARGHVVQGSDHAVYPPMSEFLAAQGIPVFDGYRPEQISGEVELVIIGNAISRGNAELEEVLDRKIRYQSLPEAIRDRFLWDARSIVVAGTHGKTTTTALVGWILTAGGRDPSVFIGGIAQNFGGSFRLGRGRDFVIEGDEYDSAFFDKTAKFLKYLPDVAVIGNLEYDHADIYPDMESLRTAFRRLVALVPRHGLIIVGADSPEAMAVVEGARAPIETFGVAPGADWRASEIRPEGDRVRFELSKRGEPMGHVALPMFGAHNVRNALAAMAVGASSGLSVPEMTAGLEEFQGVRRRLEYRGVARGVTVLDDFAHHPTAIRETVQAVRAGYPTRRIWAVFEPRSATSCRKVFQDEFVRAFAESGADEVLLARVFRATLPEEQRLSIERVVCDVECRGVRARGPLAVDEIVDVIGREGRDGDMVIVMSNGAFDGIHHKLLARLTQPEPDADGRRAV